MSVDLVLVMIAFGLFTGIGSGLLGVGGGIFMVPFLVLVAGLEQQSAQATSLAVVVPTAIVATVVLHRAGVADTRRAFAMGAVGMIGAVAGVLLALALPGSVLRIVFAVFLALIGLRLVLDAARMPSAARVA